MTRRLLLSYLTLAVIILVLLEVPLAVFFAQREEERFLADAERDAVVLASFYSDSLRSEQAFELAMAEGFSTRTGVRVLVVDSDGISVLDTSQVVPRDYSTRPEIETALSGLSDSGIRYSETLSVDLAYVAVPVATAGSVYGAVRLTADAHEVTERVRRFWYGLAAIAVVTLMAVGGIGWAIARSVTKPLRDLRTSAIRFADGNLSSTELPKDAPAEIRDLAETMNNMARRLDELIEAQRNFVSDASHQLRTPLTALRLRLENVEAQMLGTSDSTDLLAAIDETTRLSELVEGLLRLARAEESPTMSTIDLSTLIANRVDTWAAVAESQEVELILDAPDATVYVDANVGAIEQIVDNLLDNALGVAPVSSSITIRLKRSLLVTTLRISDKGQGLSDENKTKALERFWRGDRSRSGTGLGLAIALALTLASGGDLRLEDNADGGLSVVVSLTNSTGPR